MEDIKTTLDIIKRIREDLETLENRVRAAAGEEPGSLIPEWGITRTNIWKEVWERGGIVTREELHKIAKKHGIDNRGLGGFFTGKASLVNIAGNKVGLTEEAIRKMREWGVIGEDEGQ